MTLFNPNTNHIRGFRERGLFLMAWRLSVTFTVLFTALAISFLFAYSLETGLTYASIALISFISIVYLEKTRNSRPIFWTLAIFGSVLSQVTLYILPHTLPYSNFTWILAGVVLVFVTLGKKEGIIYLIVNSIGIGVYLFLGIDNHLESVSNIDIGAKVNVALEMIASLLITGYLLNQYSLYQTYASLQLEKLNTHLEQQNDAIIVKSKENITLVKEIHHRVKNNLQIIISLLRMQKSEIDSEENQQNFDDMINRVMTMSMIHQRLYQEKEASKIHIQEYLQELSQEIISLSGIKKLNCTVNSSIEFIELKTTVPLGLLINELISNSIKHAFDDEKDHSISINISGSMKEMQLNYQDSGTWVERQDDNISFGAELIEVLTEQLNGTCLREGSQYNFNLRPEED